jgi:hypothetical protein
LGRIFHISLALSRRVFISRLLASTCQRTGECAKLLTGIGGLETREAVKFVMASINHQLLMQLGQILLPLGCYWIIRSGFCALFA